MCCWCAGGLLVKAREIWWQQGEGTMDVWETDMGCFVIGCYYGLGCGCTGMIQEKCLWGFEGSGIFEACLQHLFQFRSKKRNLNLQKLKKWYRLFVITEFMVSDLQEFGGRIGRGVFLSKGSLGQGEWNKNSNVA